MKLTEFTYTKRSGDVSQRAVIVTQEPNKFLQGIDVSELDNDHLAEIIQAMQEQLDKHQAERISLLEKFDLKHSFRQFDPQLISDQTVEWV